MAQFQFQDPNLGGGFQFPVDNPTFEGFLGQQQLGKGKSSDPSAVARFGGIGAFGNFGTGAGFATDTALSSLNELLLGRGRTDPQALNKQLSDISLSTQANQQGVAGESARLGIQNSGVAQAVGAAVGQGGTDARSRAIADENKLAEERRRSDLQLFNQLIQLPGLDLLSLSLGQGRFDKQQTAQQQAAVAGGIAELVKLFASGS